MTTWMLLEDEPDLYDMILAMYGMLGISGVAFSTGEEAVDWIDDVDHGRFHGELPELALMDIRLPDSINGTDVGARIRQSPILKDTVIVLMTAYRLSAKDEEAIIEHAGADWLLYKPLPTFSELEELLKGLVEQRQTS